MGLLRPEVSSDEVLSNWTLQLDEVLALSHIFGESFRLHGGLPTNGDDTAGLEHPPLDQWHIDCSMAVEVQLPKGQLALKLPQRTAPAQPQLATGCSDCGSCQAGPASTDSEPSPVAAAAAGPSSSTHAPAMDTDTQPTAFVRHLPPIELQLRLLPGYPSTQPPQFSLSAVWLSAAQATALGQQLQHISEAQQGQPVCFAFVEWLQSSALAHVGAAGELVLEGMPCAGSVMSTSGCPCSTAGEHKQDSATQLMHILLRFDARTEHHHYLKALHTCDICFEDHPGARFVQLGCGHSYCQGCLAEQCHLHVKDGSLEQLRCPEPECKAALGPQVLRQLLTQEEFARWETLTLQRTLDRMPDTAYCPRCSAVSISDADGCAQCPECLYTYCTMCRDSWHPGSECVSPEARLAIMQAKAAGGEREAAGVAQAFREAVRKAEQDRLSLETIKTSCKRCPSCGTAIQRTMGCNHMVCANCQTHFCYACGKQLNGYNHFGEGCVMFEEEELRRWELEWEEMVAEAARNLLPNNPGMQQGLLHLMAPAPGAARLADPRRHLEGARPCRCPQCGQQNYKIGNDNNVRCWVCTNRFCYLCQKVLRGKVGSHFSPKGCKQHTPG